jgi:hypothetical protein
MRLTTQILQQTVNQIDGSPQTFNREGETGGVLTVRQALRLATTQSLSTDKQDDIALKDKQYSLGVKIWNADDEDFGVDDIAFILKRVKLFWSPEISGFIANILDPKATTTEGKNRRSEK